ncbi:hypothetical protein EV1_034075 [Malus domestica]
MLPPLAHIDLLLIKPKVLILFSCIHNSRMAEIQVVASIHTQVARAALVKDTVIMVAGSPITWCNFCNSLRHHISTCPHRPALPFAGYHAYSSGVAHHPTGYFDTGIIHHMTSNEAAFPDPTPYSHWALFIT